MHSQLDGPVTPQLHNQFRLERGNEHMKYQSPVVDSPFHEYEQRCNDKDCLNWHMWAVSASTSHHITKLINVAYACSCALHCSSNAQVHWSSTQGSGAHSVIPFNTNTTEGQHGQTLWRDHAQGESDCPRDCSTMDLD